MKTLLLLVAILFAVGPARGEEPKEVRELAAAYKKLVNEKNYDEVIEACLCTERVSPEILKKTRDFLEFGITIQSFEVEAATEEDEEEYKTDVDAGDLGLLRPNQKPEWFIVFSCDGSGDTPPSTQRLGVGRSGEEWLIPILAPINGEQE